MAEPAGRRWFAAFLDLRDRPAVVVGGGAVGEGKAEALLRAGARVTLVAPVVTDPLAEWIRAGRLAHRARRFEPADLDGAAIAVAATGERAVNAAVAEAARERGIAVNVADDPEASTFIMPAVIERGAVQVAVSTGGASPVLAARIAGEIAAVLPEAYGRLAELAAEFRPVVRRRIADAASRREFWHRILRGPVARHVLEGREAEARALLEAELARSGSGDTP